MGDKAQRCSVECSAGAVRLSTGGHLPPRVEPANVSRLPRPASRTEAVIFVVVVLPPAFIAGWLFAAGAITAALLVGAVSILVGAAMARWLWKRRTS